MPAKQTAPKMVAATNVSADAFPKQQRTSTALSPYIPDVDEMILKGVAKFYPVKTEQEFKELQNQLRSLARRNHNASLQLVFVPKDTATHKQGLYVRNGGEIKPKPRKAAAEVSPAPAKAAVKKTTARRR